MTVTESLSGYINAWHQIPAQSVALLPLSLFLCFVLYHVLLHPLHGLPGPFLAKFTKFWLTYHYFRGTWHDDILNLHHKYGRVVRIAPNEVSIVDGDASKKLYSHGHSTIKSPWYNTWQRASLPPNLFASRDPKVHAFLKKRSSNAYSMTSILKMEEYIQSCLDLCLQKLKKYAEQGRTIDMAEWTEALTYDVIGELAYGEQLGHLQTESDVMGLRQMIHSGFSIVSNMGHVWGQMTPLLWVLKTFRLPSPFGTFERWSMEKVKTRMETTSSKRDDMLSFFSKMKDVNGNPVSTMEVLTEALQIIGAGADTTAIGIRSSLYYLCSNPVAYGRLQKEIDDFYSCHELPQSITYVQTQGMPYLVAVVKESLRLLPSIVYQLPRWVPAGGMTVDGRFLPEGTVVGVSPIAQNRDPAVWGEDAHTFRPERWLEDEARTHYLDSMTMTWGGNGQRSCIGRNIALVEIHKFLVHLLRQLDVELADKEVPWRIRSYWFAYQQDMAVKLRSRDHQTRKIQDNK